MNTTIEEPINTQNNNEELDHTLSIKRPKLSVRELSIQWKILKHKLPQQPLPNDAKSIKKPYFRYKPVSTLQKQKQQRHKFNEYKKKRTMKIKQKYRQNCYQKYLKQLQKSSKKTIAH